MPESVSAFTVLGLLRDIHDNGVSDTERAELRQQITTLEGHYFEEDTTEAPDLHGIAKRWVDRVS